MENQVDDQKYKLSFWGALGMYLLYFILILSIINIPFDIISDFVYEQNGEIAQAIVLMLGELITNIIVVMLVIKRIRKRKQPNFKLKFIRKFNYRLLFYTILFIVGYFLWYQSSIGLLTEQIPMPKLIEEAFDALFMNPYAAIFSVAIIAPIFEEIALRGIILEGFLNKYKPRTAIIASALLFGLIHMNITQFINTGIIGLFLGVLYYKTRSLTLCIAAHMTNNLIAVLIGIVTFEPGIISFGVGVSIFILAGRFLVNQLGELEDVTDDYKVQNI